MASWWSRKHGELGTEVDPKGTPKRLRLLRWLPLIVVLVIGGTGGSLWAHSVIAENIAHSSYSGAASTLSREIQAGRHDGLFPSEILPYADKFSSIESLPAPSDKTFWSGSKEQFYNRQTVELRNLDKQLRSQISNETNRSRQVTSTLIHQLQYRVSRGRSFGLRLTRYKQKLASSRSDVRDSTTVGEFRALAGFMQPELAAVGGVVNARVAFVDGLVRRARLSHHPIRYVRARVKAAAAAAQQQLNILKLFRKVHRPSASLASAVRWTLSTVHVRAAAIGAADVEDQAAIIKARLQKVAPPKWILVSTEDEWIEWFRGPNEVGNSLATTGNPALPTVKGHFTIIARFSPFTFISSDPVGSQYYYAPSPVHYAMEFQSAGYYIHDAPWRSVFGPGTDGAGQPGTNYGGSHGCVNVPLNVAAFLWGWAPMGTPVIVV